MDSRIDHTGFGVVQSRVFDEETQKFKITKFKTREGDTVSLQWLLDEGIKASRDFRIKASADRVARGKKARDLSEPEIAAIDEAIAFVSLSATHARAHAEFMIVQCNKVPPSHCPFDIYVYTIAISWSSLQDYFVHSICLD